MDEQPAQLPREKRDPTTMNGCHGKREDNGHVRKETCRVFMYAEPLEGKRYVCAFRQRTRKDRAREVKPTVMEEYPQAEKAAVVTGNLRVVP